ncbi:hypothetical protein ACFQ4K_10105 [Tistrella bauzanensis]
MGWGVQFQQPVFIGLMILAMALFAASQLGAFTIRAPTLSGGLAREAVGTGGPRPGQALISGVVATLLATLFGTVRGHRAGLRAGRRHR